MTKGSICRDGPFSAPLELPEPTKISSKANDTRHQTLVLMRHTPVSFLTLIAGRQPAPAHQGIDRLFTNSSEPLKDRHGPEGCSLPSDI